MEVIMIRLVSVKKPKSKTSALESVKVIEDTYPRAITNGNSGPMLETSRSLRFLAVKGKSEPLHKRGGVHSALESIIGPSDDRVRILDTDLSPWRMVCALRLHGKSGVGAIGTGWLVGPKTIITAGHCVFSNYFFGGWAETIEVSPGRNGSDFPYGTFVSNDFSSIDRWVNDEAPDFDIGCIHIAEPIGENVGWFGVGALSPAELVDYLVNVSGYPGDRGMGTEQYHHKNRVLRVTERRVFYDVDTFGGQSGAPVWIHESDNSPPLVIGIHAYGVGGAPSGLEANSAPRILPEVLEQIKNWVELDGGWPSES